MPTQGREPSIRQGTKRGELITARAVRAAGVLVVALTILPPPHAAVAATAGPLPQDLPLLFTGGGYGHGHGLSQYGALGQARQGRGWRAIVGTYYTGVDLTQRGNPTIRALLDARKQVVFGPDDYTVSWASGGTIRSPGGTKPFTRVKATDSGVVVQKGSTPTGPWRFVAQGSGTPVARSSGVAVPVWLNGRVEYYRGAVQALRRGARTLYVIDELPLEQYIYGVVPREMPALWPMAALKAQAIAARSYSAWKRENVGAGASYHICVTTMCQAYRGYGYRPSLGEDVVVLEHPRANKAVNATAGLTMTSGGGAVFAEFHSSSGGHTAQGSRPYLAPVEDPWDAVSPYNRWEATVDVAEVQRRWPAIGRLTSLGPFARDGDGPWGGRVTTATFTGTDGSVTVSGDTVRSAFGLRSTLFYVKYLDAEPLEAPAELQLVPGESAEVTVSMRNAGSKSWTVGDPAIRLRRVGGPSPFKASGWTTGTVVSPVTAAQGGGSKVAEGEVGEIAFTVQVPADLSPGLWLETFRMNARGLTWFGETVTLPIRVGFPGAAHLGENLFGDPSFEADDAGAPAGWKAIAGSSWRDNGVSFDAAASLRMPGDPGGAVVRRASLPVSGEAGDTFALSAWNRASATQSSGTTEATATFVNHDGSTSSETLAFPAGPHRWLYRTRAVTAPKRFDAVRIDLAVRDQTGTVWFDNVRFVRRLLSNASFESGGTGATGWTIANGGEADGREKRLARDGIRSLRLNGHPSRTVTARQVVASPPAGTTIFGAWNRGVRTVAGGGTIQARATVLGPDGERSVHVLRFPRARHEWRYAEARFSVPADATSIIVQLRVKRQRGVAYFDGLVLAPQQLAPGLAANAGFELGNPVPADWRFVRGDGVRATTAILGEHSLRLDGAPSVDRYALQRLPLAGEKGDRYQLAAWNRLQGSSADGGPVRVWAKVHHIDGTVSKHRLDFARTPHDWKRSALTFQTSRAYDRIDLFVRYADQTGKAWFDGIVLQPVA
ncbi:MAG TPA: SpoIID/LytB domain-containing protein [Actinomycetota bacterium]